MMKRKRFSFHLFLTLIVVLLSLTMSAATPQPTTALQEADESASRQGPDLSLYLPVVLGGGGGSFGLNPIGEQTVPLGSTLNLALSANASASRTFGVSPLPLPDNATFNAMSGVFTFSPAAEQIGTFSLTFSVTDGNQSDSETVTISVPEADPSGETALRGRILDANDVTQGTMTPLVGATITHIESGQSTTTGSDGYFILSGLPAGASHFEYDARTVVPAGTYGAYRGEKELIANVTNVIERPIYIMRIDTAGEVDLDPNSTTVVNNPNIDTTVTIPPHTVMDESGNEYDGMISISPVPAAFTPGSLPDTLVPDQVITVQPMGLTFQTPAPVTFPNTSGLSPGSEVDIWSMDHSTSEFFVAGTGRVTADGTMIETIDGGIREASWHFPMPPAPPEENPPDGSNDNSPPPNNDNSCNVTSTVTLYNGCLGTTVSLPSYLSLGESRNLQFAYKSDRAYSQPIIPIQSVIQRRAAVPSRVSYELTVGGVAQGEATYIDTSSLSESRDEPLRAATSFDGSTFSTGVYPHRIRMTSHYGNSEVASNIRRNTLIVNQQNSSFGAGWGMAGLQRLYIQPDGNVLLTDGNGSAKLYQDLFAGFLIEIGQVVNGEISVADEIDTYSFVAERGQQVYFDLQGYSGISQVDWQVVDEDGTVIFDTCLGCGDPGVRTLQRGGTYTLTVGEDANELTGTYQFQIWNVPSADQFSIEIGDLVSDGNPAAGAGNIETPGVKDIYTFTATPGQQVYFDQQGHSGISQVNWQVVDEDGTIIFGTCLGCGDIGVRTLQRGGTYTLTVGDNRDDGFGTYQFQIWNVPSADQFSIEIGDIISDGNPAAGAGNIETPGVKDIYTFTATPGQQVYFDQQGHSGISQVNWQVVDKDGTVIFGTCLGCGDPGVRTLQRGGTYTLTVGDDRDDGFGTYQFQIIEQTGQVYGNPEEISTSLDTTTNYRAIPARYAKTSFSSGFENVVADPETVAQPDGIEETTFDETTSPEEVINFTSPDGDFSILTQSEDGTFTRRMKDGTEYHFNANGLQTSMVDRNGNTTTYAYDANNRLTSMTDPAGLVTTLTYSGDRLSRVTDPTGRETAFEHDANGNLVRVTLPDGQQQAFGYDSRHLMTSETDRRGFTTSRIYDDLGRVVSASLPDGTVRQATYSQSVGLIDPSSGVGTEDNPAPVVRPEDAISTITDGEGRTTTYNIGPLGRFAGITDAAGFTTSINRDEDANPLQTTRPSGAIFRRTYDTQGNQLSFTDETVNGTTRYTYENTFNQVTSITDPFDQVTNIQYDNQGNATQISTPLGRTFSFGYDSRGLLTNLTDPLSTESAFSYDKQGNLTQVVQGAGANQRSATLTYTSAGYVQRISDPLGRTFDFTYDALGRLTSESLPGNRTIAYQYDADSNLSTLTPPGKPAHTFEYDELGLMTAYIPPTVDGSGTTRTTYEYNNAQEVTKITRPDSKELTYSYDDAGRLTTLTVPRGSYSYGYDTNTGQLVTTGAPDSINLTYGYDGELLTNVTWSGPIAGNVSRTYDANYRTTSLSVAGAGSVNGNAISFQYDADDALTQAGDLTLDYNATTGLLNGTDLAQINDSYNYNQFAELATYSANVSDNNLYQTTYTRDKLGRITELSESIDGTTATYTYTYDGAGRLAQVERNGTPIATYTYDANGNRLTFTDASGTINGTYDEQDRLLTYGANSYAYTANGELTTKTNGGQSTTYDYDVLGNLMAVTLPDGTQIEYLVDGQDRRIGKKVNGTLVQGWLYQDSLNPVAELDGNGNITTRFVYASMSNVPDYMSKNGTTYRIISDHLGSVRLVVNTQTGEITQRIDYDAFGNVTQDTNPGFQPFGFAGGLYDTDTGLVRFGARDYDAETGRWTSKDPIGFEGGDANLYGYVANDPVNSVDPLGLQAWYKSIGPPKSCKGNDSCPVLREKRGHNSAVAAGRVADRMDRLSKGLGVDQGHYNQIKQIERMIEKCDEHIARQCSDEGDGDNGIGETVGQTAVVVGVGYIAYRCVRFLPSLVPALWGTIPANLATP